MDPVISTQDKLNRELEVDALCSTGHLMRPDNADMLACAQQGPQY